MDANDRPHGVTPLGDRIWYLRAALGWSLDKVCERSGDKKINRPNLIKIEKGEGKMTGASARSALATAFGCSVEDLVRYGDGDFGEPSIENAMKFLEACRRPLNMVIDAALLRLSYANPLKATAYTLAAKELVGEDPTYFEFKDPLTVNMAVAQIRLRTGEIRTVDMEETAPEKHGSGSKKSEPSGRVG